MTGNGEGGPVAVSEHVAGGLLPAQEQHERRSRAGTRTNRAARRRGAGTGILIPVKQPVGGQQPDVDTRTRNAIQHSLRCLGERGFALLTGRWRTLQHVTASPSKIGDIARAALVLTHFEYSHIT